MENNIVNVGKSDLMSLSGGVEIIESFDPGECPLTVVATGQFDSQKWALENKEKVHSLLPDVGAILFRGFDIQGAQGFNSFFNSIAGEALEYKNRTSPRDQVYNHVYTSTSHPADQVIHMHTENSYSDTFNRIIAFYCDVPPEKDGETPIADERKLLKSLSNETIAKFKDKKIQYVRNTIPGIGLDWRTIYQTNDASEVSEYLDSKGIDYQWVSDDHLRIKWVLPAFQTHPVTQEEVWFNHMYFGHKSLYDPVMLEFFDEENLPFATYYGDGTDIEDEVLNEIKQFYEQKSIVFKWEKNDFLLLDNMLFSHGRNSFEGKRTILTAMGQPYQFKNNK